MLDIEEVKKRLQEELQQENHELEAKVEEIGDPEPEQTRGRTNWLAKASTNKDYIYY